MTPIYLPENCQSAFQLNWSVAVFLALEDFFCKHSDRITCPVLEMVSVPSDAASAEISMSDTLPKDSDGDALRSIIACGSDITKEMEIDFAIDVPDKETGMAFTKVTEQLGFQTDIHQDEDSKRWTCYCTRTMISTYEAVIEIQKELEKLGAPFNAKTDGWGSFGNAQ